MSRTKMKRTINIKTIISLFFLKGRGRNKITLNRTALNKPK